MRTFIFFIFILFTSKHVVAQDQHVIDSLNRILESKIPDTVRIFTLIELAGNHYLSDPDMAIQYCEQARLISEKTKTHYKISDVLGWLAYLYEQQGQIAKAFELNRQALFHAKRTGNKSDEATILGNQAGILSNQGRLEEALEYNMRSLALKIEVGHKEGIASGYNNIGLIYLNQGKVVEALSYYRKSLKIDEELDNQEGVATSLENIAFVYRSQGEFASAFQNARMSLNIRIKIDDKYGQGYTLNTIGGLFEDQGKLDSALFYYRSAFLLREKLNDQIGMAYSMKNMGAVHEKLGHLDMALEQFRTSLSKFVELEDKWGEAIATCKLGGIQLNKGDMAAAETNLNRSLKLATELGYPADIRNAAKHLQRFYRISNNWKRALEMNDLYVQMRDSVESVDNKRETLRTQFRYEYEKKEVLLKSEQEKKNALASEQIKLKELQRNASIVGLGLMMLLAVVFFVQRNHISKEKQRSDTLLLNILPQQTAEELKEKGHANAKLFVQATVLFTDFKGFTAISEQMAPKELVELIDLYFRAFDGIVRKHGLEKIKTIGDSYMAVGGVPDRSRTHAADAVSAAIEMRDLTAHLFEKLTGEGKHAFEIRIGLHTGPVVAGVVGEHKFQYDIWGDTVNTASRMETSSEVGKVNISESTFELVKDRFACEFRGEIEVKDKGKMGMYFVERASTADVV